jgi:DtxR family Mn-dependent transcriptional regulator
MGHPVRDPHGELIPTEDLKMPVDESTPLSALRPGQIVTVQRVRSSDPNLLRYLEELSLIPGAQIEIKDHSPFDHNLTIKIGRKSIVLGLNITSQIFVEES